MKRRILYLAWAPFFSGAERALLLTLRSLESTDYEPVVITGTDGDFAAQVRALGITCEIAQVTRLERSRPFASMAAVARIAIAAMRFSASAIHANDIYSYQPGGYAARMLRMPIVTHLRFPDGAPAYRWLLRPGFSNALFISQSFLESALEEAPDVFTRDSSVVIYDAVELPQLWTDDERLARRKELGLPLDRPIIAMTGQVAEIKGIFDLIHAASLLEDTSAVFAILGDDLRTKGEIRRKAEQEVRVRGLSDRFHFLGFRPDGPQLTQVFDVITAPSHVEPFGLASLEGMAAQRPVVASRVGGIPEVVIDGQTGLLVNPREPADLANALRIVLLDVERAAALARNGRARAASVFSVSAHRTALTALYDRIVD